MADQCLFKETIMKNVEDTARHGQAIDGIASDMRKVANNVEVIAGKMTSMRGFIAGLSAAFGLIGACIGWLIKSLPVVASMVIK